MNLKAVNVRIFRIILYIYLSFLILVSLIHVILIANMKCQGLVGTKDNFMFVLRRIWYDLY